MSHLNLPTDTPGGSTSAASVVRLFTDRLPRGVKLATHEEVEIVVVAEFGLHDSDRAVQRVNFALGFVLLLRLPLCSETATFGSAGTRGQNPWVLSP